MLIKQRVLGHVFAKNHQMAFFTWHGKPSAAPLTLSPISRRSSGLVQLALRKYSSAQPEGEQASPEAPRPPPRASLMDRVRTFIRENGRYGVATYAGICGSVYLMSFLAVRYGLDVPRLLQLFGWQDSDLVKQGSTFAVAFLIYKLLLPARLALAIFLTPRLKPFLSRFF